MSGLEEEFPGRVKGSNVDATISPAPEICKALGFSNHGLVIRSADGAALWNQPDHAVKMEDVRAELRRLIEADG